MIETRKAHELDIVELTEDLPQYGLKRGERGAVVEVFDEPEEAYMLEFVDESGSESKIADWVRPEQIRNINAEVKALIDSGFDWIRRHNSYEAEKAFCQAVSLRPSSMDIIGASILRSLTELNDSNDWLIAIEALELEFRVMPGNVIVRNNLAVAYHNYGNRQMEAEDFDSALNAFHQALLVASSVEVSEGVRKSFAAAYTFLGIQSSQKGETEEALDKLVSAFDSFSDEITRNNLGKAYANLAERCLSDDDLQRAARFFELAQLAGHATPALHNDYGITLVRIGNLAGGMREFERGLALDPDSDIIKENLRLSQNAESGLQRAAFDTEFIPIQPQEYHPAA